MEKKHILTADSIVIGLGFVFMSGYGLQQISIAGLVVALGLLVDNHSEAIRLLEDHRFKILHPSGSAQVVYNGPSGMKEILHLLDRHRIAYAMSDLADQLYQG